MNASQVMSAPPIVLFPDMAIKEAGSVLAGHRISGAPVVDRSSKRLVGMLSEGDLLGADRTQTGVPPRVTDVMTPVVISVDWTTEITEVEALLLRAKVHRVPVLHGDEVVGVVSRHDVLKHMCRSDAAITVEVANVLKEEARALARLEVEVRDGVACLYGDTRARTRALALDLAGTVPGVLGAKLDEEATPARGLVRACAS